MTNEEILKDRRIRFAVMKGEYSRAISLFFANQVSRKIARRTCSITG